MYKLYKQELGITNKNQDIWEAGGIISFNIDSEFYKYFYYFIQQPY